MGHCITTKIFKYDLFRSEEVVKSGVALWVGLQENQFLASSDQTLPKNIFLQIKVWNILYIKFGNRGDQL